MVEQNKGGLADPNIPSPGLIIAGIRPIDVGDKPAYVTELGPSSYTNERRRMYDRRRGRQETIVLNIEPRTSKLFPKQRFLLTSSLLTALEAAEAKKGSQLSQSELLKIALADTEGAVEGNFTSNALNVVNASYFASPIAFTPEAGLASAFVTNRPLNRMVGEAIIHAVDKPVILIKELSSGSHRGQWDIRSQAGGGRKFMDVIITDFVEPLIEDNSFSRSPNLFLTSGKQNLFDEFERLDPARRFDVLLSTYGFDSVWLPEDLQLVRIGDVWYQYKYRVKVDEWHPRRTELQNAIRVGRPLENARVEDYKGIFVEHAVEQVDLSTHPFRSYLEQLANDSEGENILFPGGFIRTVLDAFATQLHDDGIFIVADTTQSNMGRHPQLPSYESGIAAQFKVDDYRLAKEILEKEYGFEVEFLMLNEAADKYLERGWEREATEGEVLDIRGNWRIRQQTCLMVIKKKK
jgi:hypothetical protein